jgi:hypothetical protein
MTSFEEVYGQKPPFVLSYMSCVLKVQGVNQTLTIHEVILHSLKENLVMVHNQMKKQAYQGRSEHQFVQGDQMFLRL